MSAVFDLARFDEYREDNRREVKSAKGGLPNSLWETYSAMANTYGGVIILGVREKKDGSWETTGLQDAARLKKSFWDTINNRNKVSVNLLKEQDVADYVVGEDVILVIRVPAADREMKPVYLNNDVLEDSFKRNHEGDYHCTRAEVQAMFRDQTRKTVDGKVLPQMEIAELSRESIQGYRTVLEGKRPGHVFLSMGDEAFLEAIGAARKAEDGRLHPTCAGLLMFGMEYKILYEYDQYFLDYREHMAPDVRWTDRIQSQSGDWSGNLYDFFTRVAAKLVLDLRKPFRLEGMTRVDETPMHGAVREALVNCLVNADFYEPRGVVIDKYPDRLILRNPGIAIVGKKQMIHGGESEPRNSNLMKMFNLIGYGERAGSGVPDIFAVWQDAGYREPTVEEQFGNGQPNRMIVTLPLVGKEPDFSEKSQAKSQAKKAVEIKERTRAIIELIQGNPEITMPGIAAALGITERKIRTVIDHMKENHWVHFERSGSGGKWVIDRLPE